MPDLATFHPIVVHFTIALLVAGVVLRWVSLTGRAKFSHHAAATLIIAGALAAVIAVESGTDAHGPAERIPGARSAVQEHEEHGERARNVALFLAAVEIAALALTWKKYRRARLAWIASAAIGAISLFVLYEAAEHGGELVYSYAGGVGTRSGEPEDVGRLLLAGLYHQARLDRDAGNSAAAAELVALAATRFPDQPEVQLLRAESELRDLDDAAGALELLRASPSGEGRLALRHGMLMVEALARTGDFVAAHRELERLEAEFPENRGIARSREQLEQLESAVPAKAGEPSTPAPEPGA